MYTEFSVKRQALFDSLDNAAVVELKGTTLEQTQKIISVAGNGRYVNNGNNYSHLRGKQSIFKRPAEPIQRCLKPRYTPDFKINPHKWTKYSLHDVDISDMTNAAGASAFLREQDELRAINIAEEETPNDNNMKIKFHQGAIQLKRVSFNEQTTEDEKPQFRGTKLLMPEHVIGQKKIATTNKKKQQRQQSPINKDKQLNLSHLYEEEDEDAD